MTDQDNKTETSSASHEVLFTDGGRLELLVEIPPLSGESPEVGQLHVGSGPGPAQEINAECHPHSAGDQCSGSRADQAACDEESKPGSSGSGEGGGSGSGCACSPPDPQGEAEAECRICLMSSSRRDLVAPCKCRGSLHYAHLSCLLRWARERCSTTCEICNSTYDKELLPVLEAEVKAQRGQQQRTAELTRQNRAQAEAAAAAGEAVVSPDRGRAASGLLLFKVLLVLGITGGLLYAVFFLGSQDGGAAWASILLRVLIFVIPVYLVYRGVSACIAYRGGIVTRSPEEEAAR